MINGTPLDSIMTGENVVNNKSQSLFDSVHADLKQKQK